jgi:hypothetical protein
MCDSDDPYRVECHVPKGGSHGVNSSELARDDFPSSRPSAPSRTREELPSSRPREDFPSSSRQEDTKARDDAPREERPWDRAHEEAVPEEQPEEDPDACKCGFHVVCVNCGIPLEIRISKEGRRYHSCDCKPEKKYFRMCEESGQSHGVECNCRDPYTCLRRCPLSRRRVSHPKRVIKEGPNNGKTFHSCDWCGDGFIWCNSRLQRRPGAPRAPHLSVRQADDAPVARGAGGHSARYTRAGGPKRVRAESPRRVHPSDRQRSPNRSPVADYPVEPHLRTRTKRSNTHVEEEDATEPLDDAHLM